MSSNHTPDPGRSAADIHSDICDMQQHLARAESERDAWRAAGIQEKYLEACSLADALELQLARLFEGLRQAQAHDKRSAREAHSDVTYDGRHYRYGSYRYDRLEDALVYAQIARARGEAPDFSGTSAAAEPPPGPAESALMAALGITPDERGGYWFGSYRYDRLADAASYARHRAALGA